MIVPRHKICDMCGREVGVNLRYFIVKSKCIYVGYAGSCSDNKKHHICEDCMSHICRCWKLQAASIQKKDNFVECELKPLNIPEYKVGDEVIRDSKRGVIVRGPYLIGSDNPEYFVQIWYGTFMSSSNVKSISLTGRHFESVEFLLNEMNREINEEK